jgi:DoxX
MTTVTAEPLTWSPVQKVTFRFFMLFFLLYIFFNPNGVLPFSDNLFNLYIQPFHSLIPWLAMHVLHLAKPITVFTGGSGDTTYDYITLLFLTVLATAGTIIWSLTDWKAKNYNKLFYWLCVIVRYYIAITMVLYGSIKVVKLQFPEPSLGRLMEPLGNMSPMGLAWNYIGASTGFNYFAGLAELTCGILLFFRKTTTLGAFLGVVVACNIMAVNYCYDVPVKLLSTALVTMCMFLLIRDSRRLVNFFLLNKDARPSNLTPHRFKTRWKNITLNTIKYLLVIYVVFGDLISAVQGGEQSGENGKKPPLYGLYNVESFVRDKDTLAPLVTDTTRWNKLVMEDGYLQVNKMNDSTTYYSFKPDTIKHKIVISTFADTVHKFIFTYSIQKPGIMLLNGKWEQDSIHLRLRKLDPKNFLLLKRGFHWVNEFPFNR